MHKRRGFSLLEMTTAVGVAAVMVMTFLSTVFPTVVANRRAEIRLQAQDVALACLVDSAALPAGEVTLEPVAHNGKSFRRNVSKVAGPDGMFQVVATVGCDGVEVRRSLVVAR